MVLLAILEHLQQLAKLPFDGRLGLWERNPFTLLEQLLAGLVLLLGFVLETPELYDPVILGKKQRLRAVAVVKPLYALNLL